MRIPRGLLLVLACLLLFPAAARAAVSVTLTPAQPTAGVTQSVDFIAVVTGTSQKRVKFAVCNGNGANCVTGGNSFLGTISIIGQDSSGNRIGRYTAPATLPFPPTPCTSVAAGCQLKIRAKMTAYAYRTKKGFATLTLTAPGVHARASLGSGSPMSGGAQGDGPSRYSTVSADGRYVVFDSEATTLVTGDTNTSQDIFLRDTCAGVASGCTPSTIRVSVATDGTEADNDSGALAITPDGRYIVFASDASNLVAGDTNVAADIFIRDTCAGAPSGCTPSTTRVSLADNGSEANAQSNLAAISADGRYVAFSSEATNLVSGDVAGSQDIFLRDTCTNAPAGCTPSTVRISVSTAGTEADAGSYAPAISADGRYVAFASDATNLVAGDTNGGYDTFLRDTCRGVTTGCTPSTVRISVAYDGSQANAIDLVSRPAISADGRFVAFSSAATNLVAGLSDTNGVIDIFLRDTLAGTTVPVSSYFEGGANNWSDYPAVSADGRFIVFHSSATDLVAGDTNGAEDIFVRDTCIGAPSTCVPATRRVSVSGAGTEAASPSQSQWPAISADGRYVAFYSTATNLVTGDTNGEGDVFLARTGAVRSSQAYVANMNDDTVSVIDTGANEVVQTLAVGDGPIALAVSPDALRAYLNHYNTNELWFLHTPGHSVVAKLGVGSSPQGLMVSPDGTRVYVVESGLDQVRVLDTATGALVTTITVGTNPVGIALTPNGRRAYVANASSNNVSVIDTDPASGTYHTVLATVTVGTTPTCASVNPAGTRLFVPNNGSNNVSVINTSTNAVVTTITVGSSPESVAFHPTRPFAYVPNWTDGTVSVINTSKNKVVATVTVGSLPVGVAVAPEGPYAYVINNGGGSVSVMDTARNVVIATIPVGSGPCCQHGVAIRPFR